MVVVVGRYDPFSSIVFFELKSFFVVRGELGTKSVPLENVDLYVRSTKMVSLLFSDWTSLEEVMNEIVFRCTIS